MRRRKYTYQLTYDGEFIVRYDRDEAQHPRMAEHKHVGANRRRVRCERKTLHDAIEELYELVRVCAKQLVVRQMSECRRLLPVDRMRRRCPVLASV
jgi:Family of unknown function (DUF6516)